LDAPAAEVVPRHLRPVHDHRFGPCTLPDEITAGSASLSHRMSGCYWRATDYYLFVRGGVSGGREWQDFRREERRRSRRRARRELRSCHGED
jgi:hypothetical protein